VKAADHYAGAQSSLTNLVISLAKNRFCRKNFKHCISRQENV